MRRWWELRKVRRAKRRMVRRELLNEQMARASYRDYGPR